MRLLRISYICVALAVCAAGATLVSCNKDDVVVVQGPPGITLDSETGIYTVKAGRELTIVPVFDNAADATVVWSENGQKLSTSRVLTMTWADAGEHYITLTVTTDGGSVSEELRVDVIELELPVISLPFGGDVITVQTGTEYVITPEIAHDDADDLKVEWIVDGVTAGTDRNYTFKAEIEGDHSVEIKTENADGADSRRFTVRVADTLPYELSFPTPGYFNSSTDRYTFAGRAVCLTPIIANLDGDSFKWSVDGDPVDCDEGRFTFIPDAPGKYLVTVTVDGMAVASVNVICVEGDEQSRFRATTSDSQAESTKVHEWVPAPGQFIGETVTGGMTGNERTHEQAIEWAEGRLKDKNYVSLGGFGGYIVVGFDHSIAMTEGEYDFSIQGNAFVNAESGIGGSNEPGIVYVMQDVNGNGMPDDEWYELRGSETGKETTLQGYAVTYVRPSGPGMNVQWNDNYGATGCIDYLADYHRQDYYYPAWIEADSYTLRGTRIEARTTQDPYTGYWDNSAFDRGYADNIGEDILSGVTEGGQHNGFKIENAMRADGTHVKLQYIDFIKVQTGVNAKAGWLGEVSTEVLGFKDLSMK